MALIYSYLFPTIFLVAFWVLYRFEQVPLVRHMGELLTVTALGGACFGLPTTMVSERERGVWRRYRLAPVASGDAGRWHDGGALCAPARRGPAAGRRWRWRSACRCRAHPFDLFIAFTCVAFAFIGLGLIIAMMADNVPAVQALGQCIFLPMLIIGGVAVPLATLPDVGAAALVVLPRALRGRGDTGVGDRRRARRRRASASVALLVIGAPEPRRRDDVPLGRAAAIRPTRGKGWVAVALAAWVVVGVVRGVARTRTRSARRRRSQHFAGASAVVPPSPAASDAGDASAVRPAGALDHRRRHRRPQRPAASCPDVGPPTAGRIAAYGGARSGAGAGKPSPAANRLRRHGASRHVEAAALERRTAVDLAAT